MVGFLFIYIHFVFYFPALLQDTLFGDLDLGNLLEANFGL